MRSTFRLIAAVALGLPAFAQAGPADYVITPSVEYGEREIEIKAGSADATAADPRKSAVEFSLGYGASHGWFTEVALEYQRDGGDKTRFDAFEWENRFQLTETGRYFMDLGFVAEIEIPREHREEGYELMMGPLLQWETDAIQWNANLLFERVFRGHADEPRVTEVGYQFQARYGWRPELDFGVQAFGEMGKWNHWEPSSEQKHTIGPAIFGKVKLAGREAIKYDAAWLLGASKAAPDNAVRVRVEYEF